MSFYRLTIRCVGCGTTWQDAVPPINATTTSNSIPAPALELVLRAATDRLISVRVDREQDVHPPVGVGVQHHQVTILGGSGVDFGSSAVCIVAVRTEPQTHGGIPGRAVSRRYQ